jgi:hypothetical protein
MTQIGCFSQTQTPTLAQAMVAVAVAQQQNVIRCKLGSFDAVQHQHQQPTPTVAAAHISHRKASVTDATAEDLTIGL